MLEAYRTFWYLTDYYFSGDYYYFPGVIIVFTLVFSGTLKLMSPYLRLTTGLALALNAIPVILMILTALILIFAAGSDMGQAEQPFWVVALTLIYAAGPYLFMGTVIFTGFFIERRAIWLVLLVVLLIWPVIPGYVYYSYEIGCEVYGRNCIVDDF